MSIVLAYLGVIFIWSTTALGISWSVQGVGFLFAVAARMCMALVLGSVLLQLLNKPLPRHRAAMQAYGVSAATSCVSMLLTYWAASRIPSGLIAVLYGTVPIWTGVLASLLLQERFTHGKVFGLLLGLLGLATIYRSSLVMDGTTGWGVSATLCAAFCGALGIVLLKRINAHVPALSLAVGTLGLSCPVYVLVWVLFGSGWPMAIPDRVAGSLIYMAAIGSIGGLSLFFHILKQLQAGHVALIQLITPVTALLLGHSLNREAVDPVVWAGAGMILLGLAAHQYQALRGGVMKWVGADR